MKVGPIPQNDALEPEQANGPPDMATTMAGRSLSATDPARAADDVKGAARYRALFDAISDGFCVIEIIFDGQRPVDYRFVEVNPAFEQQSGLADAAGRLGSDVNPGLEAHWLEMYGRVISTRQPVRVTRESQGQVYSVQAFPLDEPDKHRIGVLFSNVTARVRREEAMSASFQRLEAIVEHLPAAISVIRGSDSRLVLVNPAYQAIAPGKRMVGLTLDELWPETGQDFRSICRRVLDTGVPYEAMDDLNMIRRRPDGPVERAYFNWSLHRIQLPGDEGWGLLNASWETTQRKHAEDAARASALRYRQLVEQIPDGIFVADAAGHYTDVNPAGCALLGMTREEVIARSIPDVTMPEEHARIPYEVSRFENGAIARSEWKFRRKDGSVFIGEVTGRLNSDGQLQAVLRDITESKKVDEALRESEHRFRVMVNDLPLIVWVHDAQGRLEFVNETYCRFFGITSEEALGDAWKVLTHPDDGDAYVRHFLACLAERRPFHAQVRARRGDGQWRWMESWGRPRFGGSEYLGMVGISADISKRVEVEEALKDADRRKDEFLALLAHELRNPLAPLRNGLELLRLGKDDEALAEQARTMMQRQVNYMVRLIDDLLDVSRIARGKLELQREACDLVEIVKSAIETSAPAIVAGRHELRTEFPPDALPIHADAVRVAQVFANLLNNAARYTLPGGHIALRLGHEDGTATVTVEDDGVGIPPHMLERVFEPFTQVETRTRHAHGGLGLGLSLARSLVELHAGTIDAESDGPGCGSRFTVRLPLAVAKDATGRGKGPDADATGLALDILVVDDNHDAADSIAALLTLGGHRVATVYDGPSAIEAVRNTRPHVVLLDIGMPAMDGYEAARRIRGLGPGAPPVLVALTGYGQEGDRAKSSAAGFREHLVKPVDPSVLRALLADLARDEADTGQRHHESGGVRCGERR